ncbi:MULTISPECIES: asparagine synthetase B family protein [unclassified Nocardia]|uniref:asparagine synthase-related protein n=1 Tax=unclassified Nocardia TaxID=2637762 RepID=UPI00278C14C7|nr:MULTISPECIES: asparagine synthetase B family protein [unclassified Nocardia]
MTSIALAQARDGDDPWSDIAAMTRAMLDRSGEWRSKEVLSAVLAVGAESSVTARENLHTLPDGTAVGVSAPAWVAEHVAGIFADLDPTITHSPDTLIAALREVTGDLHCVAAIPDGGLLAYRSPMAARPLFYSRGRGALRVSSTIRGLRAAEPDTVVDPVGLAAFLVPPLCDPTGSAWAGVRRLRPGYALVVHAGGAQSIREVARVETADLDGVTRRDLVAGFRAHLLTALRRCGSGQDGVLLSGGIDSASLATAAIIGLPAPPCGFALTYSAPTLAACDERRYVDAVEKATAINVLRLPADELLPLCAAHPLGDEPEAWTYAARNWAMLQAIAASPEPRRSVHAGEGGDELLLGQVFAVADRQAHGDATGASAELRTFPNPAKACAVVQGLLSGAYEMRGTRVRRAILDIPPWLSMQYRDQSGLIDRLADGYPHLAEPGRFTEDYSRTLIGEAGAAGRVHCGGWWEDTARRAGVTIAYPFLDPDLAAWTWALPPELFRDRGIEKVVLREALPDLPATVAERRDKADARVLMREGLHRAADTIRAVADGGPLVDSGMVDPDHLRTAIDDYIAGRAPAHGPALWATVAVNTWLTQKGGTLQ